MTIAAATSTTFVSVAIPYVNAAPHVGYAFELVDADIAARARRAAGGDVCFVGGTDDHSLKNVLAAAALDQSVEGLVGVNGGRFAELAERLDVSFDEFVHTSSDARHRPAVERLWTRCADAGDLYRRAFHGSYCVGCEQFYDRAGVVDGRCPEHRTPLEAVAEENWFFRLSSYGERLRTVIEADALLIEPAPLRAEVLAFLAGGLDDISVSRSTTRARGWGIAVPGDPTQVVAVWFDALANYLSSLGYGTDDDAARRWWSGSDERIHVIGKGITRFHAVYWPAFLLSARVELPTRIHVHPYLTEDGAKISKSGGPSVDPAELAEALGSDPFRWWAATAPSAVADTDFSTSDVLARFDSDLANGVGNTLNRVLQLLRRSGTEPHGSVDARFVESVRERLANFDRRGGCAEVLARVNALNRTIERDRPWELLTGASDERRLGDLLSYYCGELRSVLVALGPVVPRLAERLLARLDRPELDGPPVPRLTAGRRTIVGRPAAGPVAPAPHGVTG